MRNLHIVGVLRFDWNQSMEDDGLYKGIIWDLDGTLYCDKRADEANIYIDAAARAVLHLELVETYATACLLCKESYKTYGDSGELFVRKFGVKQSVMHHAFHDAIDESLVDRRAGITEKEFESGNHVILTHSSQRWTRRVLIQLGISEVFPPDRVIAAEDVAFERKSWSAVPFNLAAELLGCAPHGIAVVEDNGHNLKIPHQMGMTTIQVDRHNTERKPDAHVDYQIADVADVFRLSLKSDKDLALNLRT